MVAARADYRVKSRQGVTPKECVEDAKSAVRWLRQNAAKLGIDPDRIVAAGGSAGGHIAACTALTPGLEAEGEDTTISSKPNALVLFNPAAAFLDPQMMERIGNDEALGKAISPTDAFKKDSPPTLLLFGTADFLLTQGEEFMKKSKELGHRAELFTAEGQPHGFFNRPPWREKTIAANGRVSGIDRVLGATAGGRDALMRRGCYPWLVRPLHLVGAAVALPHRGVAVQLPPQQPRRDALTEHASFHRNPPRLLGFI